VDDLDGRSFTSTEVAGHKLVPGTGLSISFEGGNLNAGAGCNGMFGEFDLEDDRLSVPSLASTKRGCDPDRHEQDRWLGESLSGGPTAELAGNKLTLTGADAAISFREPDSEITLTGTA